MSVAVYPRLGALLEANHMTVAELVRQIEARFGLSVDSKTLYRLTHADAVQRADLEIAGAAAAVLGVGLDDVFDVRAVPVDGHDLPPEADLSPGQSRRLSDLFERQSNGTLTRDERREMEGLVSEFGKRLHEYRLGKIATERGISVEQARTQVANELDGALEWWQAFQGDPQQRRAVVARARKQRVPVQPA